MAKYRGRSGEGEMARRTGKMRNRQARAVTTTVIETAYQKALRENPEIQLVLEIAQRAREMSAAQIPIDFDLGPTTTTATATTGQNLLATA
jgi:hypothetical protein